MPGKHREYTLCVLVLRRAVRKAWVSILNASPMRKLTAFFVLAMMALAVPTQARETNNVMQWAEHACDVYRYGSAEYRKCRGDTWKHIRETCTKLRGEAAFVKPDRRDEHRINTDAWCSAERRFKIID